MPSDAPPNLESKAFLRFLAGLLNRCPHWVASLSPDQSYALARSPKGVRYILWVLNQSSLHESTLQGVQAAQLTLRAERAILVILDEPQNPSWREEARDRSLELWTLSEVDYLIMAADLESNAPLAYLGLEVGQPKTTLVQEPVPARQSTQGF